MRFRIAASLALLLAVSCIAFGQKKAPADDYLYNEIVTIRGKVTDFTLLEGHDSSVGNSEDLIFQRLGCKKCLIYVRSDCDGNYKLQVGRGKYRVISRHGTRIGELVDILAPSQPRIVDATKSRDNEFNIKIVLPFEPVNITLPEGIKSPCERAT
jgi:hypothetical protein